MKSSSEKKGKILTYFCILIFFRCILAEMVSRQPLFKGNSEIDQMRLISKICGSPNETNYPGWKDLTGVKNADPNGLPDKNPEIAGEKDFGRHQRQVKPFFQNVSGLSV